MTRIVLSEEQLPDRMVQRAARDARAVAAAAAPATREPVGPDDLAPLFPMGLIAQRFPPTSGSTSRAGCSTSCACGARRRSWRRAPRAALGTSARIYYKDESVSPAGSHKPNTAVAQAFYNQAEGVQRISTETGPGNGAARCACAPVRARVQGLHGAGVVRAEAVPQDPDGDAWGSEVVPSPIDNPTIPGRSASRSATPCTDAVGCDDTHYSLGSVLNHVLLHQTVIGLEAKEQLALAGGAA